MCLCLYGSKTCFVNERTETRLHPSLISHLQKPWREGGGPLLQLRCLPLERRPVPTLLVLQAWTGRPGEPPTASSDVSADRLADSTANGGDLLSVDIGLGT